MSNLAPLRESRPGFPGKGASFDIRDIAFGYEGQQVFQHLDLAIAPGEFVAVLGPSGCGKTTLLNLLSGFLRPLSGSVTLAGQPVHPDQPELGYVFQTPQLFPWLTVARNVRFGLDMMGEGSVSQRDRRVQEMLQMVGLGDVGGRLPHQLSGGMQQRVSLARTLVMAPRLLFMDEPFAALDAINRRGMNELVARLWRQLGQTVVFVTHDVDEAVLLADRIVMLDLVPRGIHSVTTIDLPRPRDPLSARRNARFNDYVIGLSEQIAGIVSRSGERA